MESVESKIGYYPSCPHCGSNKGLDIAVCPHTVGASGPVELVSCKSCHKIIQILYPIQNNS